MRSRLTGGVPSVEVFLRDPSLFVLAKEGCYEPYISDFRQPTNHPVLDLEGGDFVLEGSRPHNRQETRKKKKILTSRQIM